MCLRWQLAAELSRTIFLFSVVPEHGCASHCPIPVLGFHPSPFNPAFLTSHSLLIHLLIITVLRNFSLFWMVHPHYCCPRFFLLFLKPWLLKPHKDFFHHLASMTHWSLPVHPDFARACLDAVTCLVSPPCSVPASPWFHSSHSFLFWRTRAAPIFPFLILASAALVPRSFAPVLVWWPPSTAWFQRIQTHLSCTSSPTGPGALKTPLGQNPRTHCSSTWGFQSPFPSPWLFLSPKAVTAVSLCQGHSVPHVPSCGATQTPLFHWSHSLSARSKCHTRFYVHFTWLYCWGKCICRYPGKSREMFFKTWPNTSPWAYSWLKSVAMRLKWC